MPTDDAIEGSGDIKTVRKHGWTQAGPGRPKGRQNNRTLQQKEFADRVLGAQGSPEFDEFVASVRQQLIAGSLPPAITTLLLHYAYGKPKEIVEVEGGPIEMIKIVRVVVDPAAMNGDETATETRDEIFH
jgi:hypothetical protein